MLSVEDGLTNGAYGTIQYIHEEMDPKDGNEKVSCILVHFDSDRVGVEAKRRSPFKKMYPDAVPIMKIEVSFQFISGKKTVFFSRCNFPLSLGWAVTIHKVQGMTVDEIVVDMMEQKGKYKVGQAYVALSHVRKYEKLHIINYRHHQIRTSRKVHREMKRLRKVENRLPPLPKPVIVQYHENKVSIGHLNVQNLGSKETGKYLDFMSENDIQLVDVLCITETHLKKEEEISSKDISKEKGSVFRCDRSGMKGGGVAMVISSKYEHRKIKIPPSGMEVVVAEIHYPIKTIIVAVYISPGHKKSSSIDNLRSIITHIDNSQNERIVIMGDFNRSYNNWNTSFV